MDGEAKAAQIWRPTHMNLGSGKDYKPGWLNVDILERAHPDLVLDLGQEVALPVKARTLGGGHVVLEANSLDAIYANNVLEHVPDLPCLMTNLLSLLKDNGRLELEINDIQTIGDTRNNYRLPEIESLSKFTECFWNTGWFNHRFEIVHIRQSENIAGTHNKNKGVTVKVSMRKITTTLQEKTSARAMMGDFENIPSDIDEFLEQ
jgi:SAM-dependent methyltransferase